MRKLNGGFSLVAALFLMVMVTATVALVGTMFIKSLRLQVGMKLHRSALTAAETAAGGLMDYVSENNGSLPVVCKTAGGLSCSVGCSASESCICSVDWSASSQLSSLKDAVENSSDIKGNLSAYLLRNCTFGNSTIYLVEIGVKGKMGDTAYVYFAYNDTNGTVTFPLYFEY